MTDQTATELLECASQLIDKGEIIADGYDCDNQPLPSYSKVALLSLSNVFYSLNPDEWTDVFYQWRKELLPDFLRVNANDEHSFFGTRVQHFANLHIEEVINNYIWNDVRKLLAEKFPITLPLSTWEVKEMQAEQSATAFI